MVILRMLDRDLATVDARRRRVAASVWRSSTRTVRRRVGVGVEHPDHLVVTPRGKRVRATRRAEIGTERRRCRRRRRPRRVRRASVSASDSIVAGSPQSPNRTDTCSTPAPSPCAAVAATPSASRMSCARLVVIRHDLDADTTEHAPMTLPGRVRRRFGTGPRGRADSARPARELADTLGAVPRSSRLDASATRAAVPAGGRAQRRRASDEPMIWLWDHGFPLPRRARWRSRLVLSMVVISFVRFGFSFDWDTYPLSRYFVGFAIATVIHLIINYFSGLYEREPRLGVRPWLPRALLATGIGVAVQGLAFVLLDRYLMPRLNLAVFLVARLVRAGRPIASSAGGSRVAARVRHGSCWWASRPRSIWPPDISARATVTPSSSTGSDRPTLLDRRGRRQRWPPTCCCWTSRPSVRCTPSH